MKAEKEISIQKINFIEKFKAFFETEYRREIDELAQNYPDKKSIEIDFNKLAKIDIEIAYSLLENPEFYLKLMKNALQSMELTVLDLKEFEPNIRIFNLPKDANVALKKIGSKHLGKLIEVEGIIKQITDTLPRLKIAVFKCRSCNETEKMIQQGQHLTKPLMCKNCKHRDLKFVEQQSEFSDYQKIQIQEPLEYLRGNDQPTNLDIYLSDDLVNLVNAGDKIKITGTIKLYPAKNNKIVFGRYMEAIHLKQTAKEFDEIEISKEDEKKIRELALKKDIYERLIQSIAPGIFGHETLKEAIVLQLFGGAKKVLPGDHKIRGNIHILIVGDPGMAKSQLLMAASKIAPKSIYVGGKTTSSVGLTAAAVKDEFGEGGWTLKAGALVLASGGTCMADELDKMDKEDRTALHEAMEQGMISVAKAGIVSRFNTDTSILAAANPKFSRFDPFQNFMEQIDLPPTLISRFDLFFMVKDTLDKEKDRQLAEHILKTHQAGQKLKQASKAITKLSKKEQKVIKEKVSPKIEQELLRKYISYARQNVFPVLTEETMKLISDFYVDLRSQGKEEGSYSATHRQLEGLVRLSEASARVRLSNTVEKIDAERAIKLVKTSLMELVKDPETGKIDIDIITSGQSRSQTENMRKVLQLVKEKSVEKGKVAVEEIIEEAKTIGIEPEKTRDYLSKLKVKGELYEPSNGFVKPVTQK